MDADMDVNYTTETTLPLSSEELRLATRITNLLATGRVTAGTSKLDAAILELLESDEPLHVRKGLSLCGDGNVTPTEKGRHRAAQLRDARMLDSLDFTVGDEPAAPAVNVAAHEVIEPPAEPAEAESAPAELTERDLRIQQVNELLTTVKGGDLRAIYDALDRHGRGRLRVFEVNLKNMYDAALDRLFGDLVTLQAQQEQAASTKAARRALVTEITDMVMLEGRDYTDWWSRQLGENQRYTLQKRQSSLIPLEDLDKLVRVMRRKLHLLEEARASYKGRREGVKEFSTAKPTGTPTDDRSKPEPKPLIHLSEEEQRKLLANRPNAQPGHPTRVSDVRKGGKPEKGTKGKSGGRKKGRM